MNLIEFLNKLAGRAAKAQTSLPGWRQHPYPGVQRGGIRRVPEVVACNYDEERFIDREKWEARYREMKSSNSGTVRWSTSDGGHIVWVVAWPRS